MDNSKKRLFASFAVLAFVMCVFASVPFMMDDESEVEAVTVSGSNVTFNVGQDDDFRLYNQFGNTTSSSGVTGSTISTNIPEDLGLTVSVSYNSAVGMAFRMELHISGSPNYAVNSGTDWNGNYTITVHKGSSSGAEYIVTGTITVNAVNTSGSAVDTGTSSKPISYIDKGYGYVKNATDYYIYQYSKVYITTDYKATISSSSYGIEYCDTQVFSGGNDGGKVFGYLTRTGTVSITFDTGTDGGNQTITLHVVADKTGSRTAPLDDLSRSLATFANMTSPNSLSGSIGSGKTYYVELGSYIGIWHHQLAPDNKVNVTDVSPSMTGLNTNGEDAWGNANSVGTYTFTMQRGSYTTTSTIVVIDPDAVTATSVSISAGTGGSSITLEANCSPSNANVSYSWEIVSGDSYGHLSSYSGDSITVYPDSYGRMQIRLTEENSGRTATDYIYVFEMAFNANGGSSAPSSILAIDDLSTYRIDIPSSEPYRSGWEFMGWSTSSGGSPSYEYGDDYSCSYSSLRTMYAIWGDYGYLTFNKNGGSGSVPSQQSLLIQEDDYDYITIPSSPTPTMSGMEFVGWCTNSSGTGTIYYPGDDVDVDCGDTVTLYAIFEDPYETFTLTYNANGGYGAPSRDEGESRTGSYTFTLDASTIPTNGAFTFLGWCADSNGSGTIYQPGSNFTTSDTNDTVYAIWQASYTLTYVGGPGATNVPGTQTHEAISTSSYSFTISSQTPTLTGSIFKGWDTSSQATTAVYQPGGSVSVDCNATVTLYAVWETAQIEITTTQGNEVVNMGESFSYTVGTSVSGCTISVSGADWLSVSGNVVSGTPSGPGTYTVTITASLDGYVSDTQQFQITVYSQMGFNSSPSASGIYAYVGD